MKNQIKKYPKIIFMGSKKIAYYSLYKLIKNKYNIITVITLFHSDKNYFNKIKELCYNNNIPIIIPKNIRSFELLKKISVLNPDIQIVISFKLLPKEIWNFPKLGSFNLHASLLPQYRGAAPISWAIINGEKKTGVTTFLIDNNVDTGKILLQKEIVINYSDTAGDIYNKAAIIGSNIVIKTLKWILEKTKPKQNQNQKPKQKQKQKDQVAQQNPKRLQQNPKRLQQNPKRLQQARKLYSTDCRINWKLNINIIYNKIRGLSPQPTAWTNLYFKNKNHFKKLKIFKVRVIKKNHNYPYGTLQISKDNMFIYCKKGLIDLLEIQMEGKKKLNIKNFINGIINQKKNISIY
jgi:methionyl-tRNA formyltransferase